MSWYTLTPSGIRTLKSARVLWQCDNVLVFFEPEQAARLADLGVSRRTNNGHVLLGFAAYALPCAL